MNHDDVLALLGHYSRVCHDNAREYAHQYREACDRLQARIRRSGTPDPDHTYMVMKPKDDDVQTAMSRWRWWRDEAIRVHHEIQAEAEMRRAGADPLDPWYVHTLVECLEAARAANTTLHRARRRRDAMTAPTIPLPRVQTRAHVRTETPR